MQPTDYGAIYNWAHNLALSILKEEGEDGEKLLRNLYYSIRGEETPGRFYDSLTKELGDLRFTLDLEVYGKKELFEYVHGDSFHLVRAAIIMALINAKSEPSRRRG